MSEQNLSEKTNQEIYELIYENFARFRTEMEENGFDNLEEVGNDCRNVVREAMMRNLHLISEEYAQAMIEIVVFVYDFVHLYDEQAEVLIAAIESPKTAYRDRLSAVNTLLLNYHENYSLIGARVDEFVKLKEELARKVQN